MKRILVATDFSVHSRHALEHVIKLVQDSQELCRVLLLNTYQVKETDPQQAIHLHDELRKISKEKLEKERILATQLVTNPHVIIETASQMGSLKNVILQFLKFGKIDLVVLGKDENKNIESLREVLKQHQCRLLVTTLQ